MIVGLLFGMELLVRVFAGGWLLDGALRSVFARRWRIYYMMLVDGFRWFVVLGCMVVCVAVGWRLWKSVIVEGMLFDDVGWFMLVSL